MADNTTGIHNIRELNASNTSIFNGTTAEQFTKRISDVLVSQTAGSYEVASLGFLAIVIGGMFKADVNNDVMIGTTLPLTIFMAYQGYLPGGEGIVFASLIGSAAIGGLGVVKYVTR